MGLFKRAHVRGITHELTRQGIVSWMSKMAEEETADAVADAMPEEAMPEVSGEEGLSPEQTQEVINTIIEVAQDIAAKSGVEGDVGVNKESAALPYEAAASQAAISLMEKAAEEGPMVPGQDTPEVDLSATAEGQIDASNTPSADWVGERGVSALNTSPGAIGEEETQPQQPGAVGSEPTGEVAKLSSLLQQLSSWSNKMAVDGASLSGGAAGGPAPTPRTDLSDNLKIPGAVASGRGMSAQDVPASAYVGQTMAQPAGTPGATVKSDNEPSNDALKKAASALRSTSQGREFLHKLALEEQQNQRENVVANALRTLAGAAQ